MTPFTRHIRSEHTIDRSQSARWHVIVVALVIMATVAVVALGQVGCATEAPNVVKKTPPVELEKPDSPDVEGMSFTFSHGPPPCHRSCGCGSFTVGHCIYIDGQPPICDEGWTLKDDHRFLLWCNALLREDYGCFEFPDGDRECVFHNLVMVKGAQRQLK